MLKSWFLPFFSFSLSMLLMPLAVRLANRFGLLDCPDGRRKLQKRPIPVVGGLNLFVVLLLTSVVVVLLGVDSLEINFPVQHIAGLVLAASVLCFAGLLDDRFGIRGRHKLFCQVLACGIVAYRVVRVRHITFLGFEEDFGTLFSYPVTVMILLGSINAFNLLDGMDGLVGMVSLLAAGSFATMAYLSGHSQSLFLALILMGAIAGFLYYNLPPARVYLGDAGSMMLGLLFGVLAIKTCTLPGSNSLYFSWAATILLLPIIDTSAAILRRKMTRRSIYSTDRAHIHHCLLHRGLTRWGELVIVASMGLIASAAGVLGLYYQTDTIPLVGLMIVLGILVSNRLFGHTECRLVARRFLNVGSSLINWKKPRTGREQEIHLQGSTNWNEPWQKLTTLASEMDLIRISMDINAPVIHEEYHAYWEVPRPAEQEEMSLWRVVVPIRLGLKTYGRIEIMGDPGVNHIGSSMAAVNSVCKDVERLLQLHHPETHTPPPATIPLGSNPDLNMVGA